MIQRRKSSCTGDRRQRSFPTKRQRLRQHQRLLTQCMVTNVLMTNIQCIKWAWHLLPYIISKKNIDIVGRWCSVWANLLVCIEEKTFCLFRIEFSLGRKSLMFLLKLKIPLTYSSTSLLSSGKQWSISDKCQISEPSNDTIAGFTYSLLTSTCN